MSEEKSYIPSLTLEPNAQAVAAVAAEVKEEEKAENIPVERLELSKLSPAEQAAVTEFSKKIDILNTEQVLNYGSNAQKNISEFSDSALSAVRTKDLGEVGDMLSDLVVELKGLNFDPEQKKVSVRKPWPPEPPEGGASFAPLPPARPAPPPPPAT